VKHRFIIYYIVHIVHNYQIIFGAQTNFAAQMWLSVGIYCIHSQTHWHKLSVSDETKTGNLYPFFGFRPKCITFTKKLKIKKMKICKHVRDDNLF